MRADDMRYIELHQQGFDRTRARETAFGLLISPRCSRCEALVINGVAAHETGCPNQTHECAGCNAIVPRNVKYCEDCQ